RAAVAGSFADQEHRRVRVLVQVAVEALREPVVAVLVERAADLRRREPVYQRSQRTTSSTPRRRCVKRLVARLAFGSGRGLPTVTPATTWTSSGMPSRSLNACISGTVTPYTPAASPSSIAASRTSIIAAPASTNQNGTGHSTSTPPVAASLSGSL